MFVLGEPDLNQCWETWVQHFPAVFSVGGWDWNRDSIPLLSKEEMRVFFGWMLCPGLISHEEMQLTISLFLSHAPTNTHTVSDMLTFPHRHLSLSLCGCKVFSLPPTLPSNNERACAYTRARVLCITPSRCHESSSEASRRGRISLCENCGRGEQNQHCLQSMFPLHHCCTNTGL